MNMKGKDVARTPRYAVQTRLMTVRDLSIYLHVHKSTIYRMLGSVRFQRFVSAMTGALT